MKTNYTQALKWIKSAIEDIKRVFKSKKSKDYADVAFRSQFAIEKLNKAIINILGLKVEKTHNPTKIIKKALKEKENLRLKPEGWEVLLNIVNTSEFFEKQGTITRYGLIKGEDLIFPEEIYNSKEKILDFLSKFKIILENTIIFLQDIMNFSEKDFPVIKDLKKWIEAKKLWK